MVWVGSLTGLRLRAVRQPVLSVFTGAGIQVRRADEDAAAAAVPPCRLVGPWCVPELCDRLSSITNASIWTARKSPDVPPLRHSAVRTSADFLTQAPL